jgi:hypothetical protein
MKTILLAVLAVCAAVAQSLTEPPALVRLHRRLGAASASPYADARSPVNVVGMAAVTGPPENWLIEVHDSFASIEAVDKSIHPPIPSGAMDDPGQSSGDILAGSRSLIAVYRPGFSYLPEQAVETLRKAGTYVFLAPLASQGVGRWAGEGPGLREKHRRGERQNRRAHS